jgi:hypothetical protein
MTVEIEGLTAAFAGYHNIGLCTVFQAFDWGPFECGKTPDLCRERSWPPYMVMRAMAFTQVVLGSQGLIGYAYYAQFGYPGTVRVFRQKFTL